MISKVRGLIHLALRWKYIQYVEIFLNNCRWRFLAFINRDYQINNIEDNVRQSQIFWGLIFDWWKADIMHFGFKGRSAICGIFPTSAGTQCGRLYQRPCLPCRGLLLNKIHSRQGRWSSPKIPEKSYILTKPGGWQDACYQVSESNLPEAG